MLFAKPKIPNNKITEPNDIEGIMTDNLGTQIINIPKIIIKTQ
ncbi:MAG: hypothetical protein V1910_03200 [bacterium]